MSISKRGEGFVLSIYNSETRRKHYVGTFSSREEALEVHGRLKADPNAPLRRCRVCRQSFRPMYPEQVRCGVRCQEVKPTTRRTRHTLPLEEREHCVYICSDVNGEVLYIGVTGAGIRRHHEHAREAAWWRDVETIKVEHFASRDEALEREALLVSSVRPLANTLLISAPIGT